MTRLNRDAAEALHEIETRLSPDKRLDPIHAVTDVTGFALLGHAREMAIGSGVSLKIDHTRIEYLPGAIEASRDGFFSGGMKNNRDFVEGCVSSRPGPRRISRAALRSANFRRPLAAIAPELRRRRAGRAGKPQNVRAHHRRSRSEALAA